MAASGRKQTLAKSAVSVRYAPKAAAHMVVSEWLLMTQSGLGPPVQPFSVCAYLPGEYSGENWNFAANEAMLCATS
jgi:hypothetical protein